MNHPADAILIDALAQPGGVTDALRRHLAQCPACQQRLDELRLVHDLLGDLPESAEESELTKVDLWPALKRRLASHDTRPLLSEPRASATGSAGSAEADNTRSLTLGAQAESPIFTRRDRAWWASGTTWRAAALVMLSIGLGHLTARITADSTSSTNANATTTTQPDATTVASAEDLVAADLYLDRFASPSPLGLSSIVLTDSTDAAQEVSP
jgi:hypothetical protein